MENGQVVRLWDEDNGAKILRHIVRILIAGRAQRAALSIACAHIPADHLSRGAERGCRNSGSVDAVVGGSVSVLSIVKHRNGRLCSEHDAIGKGNRADGPKGGRDLCRYKDIVVVAGQRGRGRDIGDNGAEVFCTCTVISTWRRRREITRLSELDIAVERDEFSADEKVAFVGC